MVPGSFDSECVVGSVDASAWFAADDFDGAGGFFAFDHIFGPAGFVEGWVDKFGAGVCFVVWHRVIITGD